MTKLTLAVCVAALIASKGLADDAKSYVQSISSHQCDCVDGECMAPAAIRVREGFAQASSSDEGRVNDLLSQLVTFGLANIAADCFRTGDFLLTSEFEVIENEVVIYGGIADLSDDWSLTRLILNWAHKNGQ